MAAEYVALTAKDPTDTVASTDWNQIRTNFQEGVPDQFTAKGDLLVGSATADDGVLLTVGANDTVLVADSTTASGLRWAGPLIYARYSTNTDQTFGTGSASVVDFEDVAYDSASAVTVGATWNFTVPAGNAGYYLVCAHTVFEAAAWDAGEYLQLQLFKGGVLDSVLGRLDMQAAGTFIVSAGGSHMVSCASGDTLDIRVLQNSGGNLILEGAAPEGNWVSIARIF